MAYACVMATHQNGSSHYRNRTFYLDDRAAHRGALRPSSEKGWTDPRLPELVGNMATSGVPGGASGGSRSRRVAGWDEENLEDAADQASSNESDNTQEDSSAEEEET